MKNILLFTALSSFTFTACISEKKDALTADEIISKSITFHDPQGEWPHLAARFYFDSRFHFADSSQENLLVSIDVQKNYLRYQNLYRKVDIEYWGDSCISHHEAGECDQYKWTHNFYTYIWGLPMKLKDLGVHPEPAIKSITFNNRKCYAVDVHYEAENYCFYFDSVNYQLRGFVFLKNDDSGKGEIVYLDSIIEFDQIKFPKKKTYIVLPDSSLGGTNEAMKIASF